MLFSSQSKFLRDYNKLKNSNNVSLAQKQVYLEIYRSLKSDIGLVCGVTEQPCTASSWGKIDQACTGITNQTPHKVAIAIAHLYAL